MGHRTRHEQRELATTLRASGRTWVDIATTLRAKWPQLNARAAMRVAHGWNQSDSANAWNELWPDRPKSDKDVGLWEIRRPGFATLDRLARLYECSVADLVADIGDYRHLDTAGRRPATIRVHPPAPEPMGTVVAVPQDEQSRALAQRFGEHDADAPPQAPLSASTGFPLPDALAAGEGTITPAELDGIEAIELMRRVEATDAGPRTLAAIAHGVDRLCSSYTHVAPADLLTPLRAYQGYVSRLLEGRTTLAQRKELMRHAGWLSLLVATACIDLGYDRAAATNFRAARGLADETGDCSLAGWLLETQAWQALSNGDPTRAADLCRAGLDTTARGTSAHVQLCTQFARASARLGDAHGTHRLVDDCSAMADRMPPPGQAEHHFVCDPRRVVAFCAAALVWLGDGDGIADEYARRAVAQYETHPDDQRWVHRLAVARLNLALLLARDGQPTEAAHLGSRALEASWRLCLTDLFLAADLDHVLTSRYRGDADVTSFHDRYITARHSIGSHGNDAVAASAQP